jgi:hypothetical protein
VEQLVVRRLPSPSPRSVFVGDVVVLESPLPPSVGTTGASHLMVRRGGALGCDRSCMQLSCAVERLHT